MSPRAGSSTVASKRYCYSPSLRAHQTWMVWTSHSLCVARVYLHVCMTCVYVCEEIRIIQDIHLFCGCWGDWVGLGDMMALSQRITLLSLPFCLSHAVVFRSTRRSHLIMDAACAVNAAGAKQRIKTQSIRSTQACVWIRRDLLNLCPFLFAVWHSPCATISMSRAM